MKRFSKMRDNLTGSQSIIRTIIVFALAFAVVLAASYGAIVLLENNAHSAAEKRVLDVVNHIDRRISEVESVTLETALSAQGKIDNPEALTLMIHDFVTQNDFILGSTIAFEPYAFEEYGRCFAPYSWIDSDERINDRQLGEETDYYKEEWYAEAKSSGDTYWCEPYFDEGGAKIMMCTFSVPIKDDNGDLVAVLTADIGLADLEEYINTINPYPDSYIILRSAKGNVLVNAEHDLYKGNVNVFAVIGTLLLIVILLVVFVYRVLRNIQNSASEEYINILEAIAARYDVMYRIDLEHARTDFIKGDEDAKKFLSIFDASNEERLFNNFNKYYVDAVIHKNDRENVRSVMNAQNVHQKLKNENELSVTYRAKRNLTDYVYTEMSMIKLVEKDDQLDSVIVAFKVVDAEVKKQMSDAEQMRIALETEKVFRNVLTDTANGFLQANLSKNRIEGIVTDILSSGERIEIDPISITNSDSYDEFEKWWAENGLISNPDEFLEVSNCEYLISQFDSGERKVNVFCTSKDENGNPKESRQEYYLYKDSVTGDILTFCIVWDITEEKEIERQLHDALASAQSANEAKTNFLFNMSHDIRTPMNAIIGYTAKAITHEDEHEVVNDCLEKIDYAGQQLLSLVNQVLQMARIESGTVVFKETATDAIKQAKKVVDIVGVLAKNKGIDLTLNTSNVVHRRVLTDADSVNQIVLNILGNAVKYTPEGGKIDFTVSEKDYEKPNCSRYEIMVSDTGIGMSREYLEHIFENFSREQNSTISGIQGAGLGMAIVKRLVDALNGTIDIVSEPNVGTTVTVSIPMKWNLGSEDTEDKAGIKSAKDINFAGKRVLLVEDNEMNREIAQDILEEAGFSVETAEDGDIAVDMIRKTAEEGNASYYDVVLMDIQMPRMNGYEAAKAIRAIPNLKNKNLPIIALSANAFEEDRQKSLEAGMDDHVAKPINIAKLKQTLNRHLLK